MKLYIGNKNYSSWSMRPWVLMRQLDLPFEEVAVRFDGFDATSQFKQTMLRLSPLGQVPVLRDGQLAIWDTLAIIETLAERFPHAGVWPAQPSQRARARSLCAEMHAGFGGLRSACPMNIDADLPQVGALALRDKPQVRHDLDRLVAMWSELLEAHPVAAPGCTQGMLFGAFSAVDAMYAPVVMRLRTYQLPVPPAIAAYMARVCAMPGVAQWISAAQAERDFLDFEEPHRVCA